jgi:hypothetical protein
VFPMLRSQKVCHILLLSLDWTEGLHM